MAFLFNNSWQYGSIKGGDIHKAGRIHHGLIAEGRTHVLCIIFHSLLEECFPSHSRWWALNAACRNPQFLEHTVTRGPLPSALAYSTVLIELKWPQTCYLPTHVPSVLAPWSWAVQFYPGLRKWHFITGHLRSGQRGRFSFCLHYRLVEEGEGHRRRELLFFSVQFCCY